MNLKRILKKIFCLSPGRTCTVALPSFVAVVLVFRAGLEDTAFAYIAYIASAYAMILVTTGGADILRVLREKARHLPLLEKISKFPLGERLVNNVVFRTEVALYPAVIINLGYAAVHLGSGVYYHSSWSLSLAGYYIVLGTMRFLLLRRMDWHAAGKNRTAELRRYLACGALLLLINQFLIIICAFMFYQNRSYDYPGSLIYAMAIYTFYALILAITNFIKFRNHPSPVFSAAKIISLTAALVSILSLETAMIDHFGELSQEHFRRVMTGAVGAGVCAIVFSMAVFMIVRARKELRQLQHEGKGG